MYGYHRDLQLLPHSFPTRRSSDLKSTQQSIAWVAALDCFAPLAMTDYARTDIKVLILFGDPHLQPVERVAERNLARQPRIFVAIARRIEQEIGRAHV